MPAGREEGRRRVEEPLAPNQRGHPLDGRMERQATHFQPTLAVRHYLASGIPTGTGGNPLLRIVDRLPGKNKTLIKDLTTTTVWGNPRRQLHMSTTSTTGPPAYTRPIVPSRLCRGEASEGATLLIHRGKGAKKPMLQVSVKPGTPLEDQPSSRVCCLASRGKYRWRTGAPADIV